MMSMHGCGEHDDAPRPYLHTMGPREHASSVVAGLRRGYRFGLIGSTDHHSAHPGSHGHGRLAVWAPELSRQSIWDAVQARRTYALTGDRIVLGFELDGVPMGSAAAPSRARAIEVAVDAGAPLDYVEVVRNGDVIHRAGPSTATVADAGRFAGLVEISMGWGERGTTTQWDVELEVVDGSLDRVEPRFRGDDIVAPSEDGADSGHFSSWERTGDRSIRLRTRTRGNATTTTDGTQRMNLRIVGDDNTRIRGRFNGEVAEHTVGELRQGSRSGYIGGFVAPAFLFGRAVPDAEITSRVSFVDEMPDDAERSSHDDWYYVRVRQRNDQWAWSSPIWVQRTT